MPITPEDRKATLRAEIAALPARRTSDRANATKVSTDFLSGAYGIVIQAAKARRLSMAAYVRRAAYAMACHDLEIPLSDALLRDPRMTRDTGFAIADPDGDKFGLWEIDRLIGEGADDVTDGEPA